MARILITDGQERSALAVVRSLGRAGHDVYVAAARGRSLAGSSRYAAGQFEVPDPGHDPEAFTETVALYIREHRIQLLLPITDAATDLLFHLHDEIPGLLIPIASRQAYEAVSDKHGLTAIAAREGILIPTQRVFDNPSELQEGIDFGLPYPVVLKPARSSVRTELGMAKASVALAQSATEARALAAAIPTEAYPVLVQEQIQGPGLGVFLLIWDGQVLASFAHRRLREKPPTGGVSVYRESVALDAGLLQSSVALLNSVRWSGVAMIEFKEDMRTGRPYLMEINGRFWGSLQLAVDSGVDFPLLLIRAATGETHAPAPEFRTGIRSRWLWGDFDHLHIVLRLSGDRRKIHPELPSRVVSLARFLLPWRLGDRLEVLWLRDPAPFIRETLDWFAALIR